MDFLARDSAGLSPELWEKIDRIVVDTARKHLVCRRFLKLFGPLGAGMAGICIDKADKTESLQHGIAKMQGRQIAELPLLYEDFTIFWRDLEQMQQCHMPWDLSAVAAAARRSAIREDELILFGNEALGLAGLRHAQGSKKIAKSDWNQGENAFADVAKGIAYLMEKSFLGRYALVVSPDLYLAMQRLQTSAGMLEIDRVAKLVNGHVYQFGAFGANQAVLVCAEPDYMDLAVGLDLAAGYLELKDFNHVFRIMETVALRIKEPQAIVVFE